MLEREENLLGVQRNVQSESKSHKSVILGIIIIRAIQHTQVLSPTYLYTTFSRHIAQETLAFVYLFFGSVQPENMSGPLLIFWLGFKAIINPVPSEIEQTFILVEC